MKHYNIVINLKNKEAAKRRQKLTLLFIVKVKEHYSDVPIYVIANGVQEDPARFKDSLRVYYLYSYINEALKGESKLLWLKLIRINKILLNQFFTGD